MTDEPLLPKGSMKEKIGGNSPGTDDEERSFEIDKQSSVSSRFRY